MDRTNVGYRAETALPPLRMAPDLRSLLSALKFGELRMSDASTDVDASGGLRALRVAQIELRDVDLESSLGRLRAASVELSNVTVRLPLGPSASAPPGPIPAVTIGQVRLKDASLEPRALKLRGQGAQRHWRVEPLGSLAGSLHADIVDAAWIFDADVTIPISDGRIDFNRATVEHIGPDSSMGVSRMGLYVDAPNGRTYLFLLSATHVPGARFEQRRGGLLRAGTGDRGSIELRPLIECWLTGMRLGTMATGTRDMMARTRVSGEFRLGDGVIGDERHRVVLTGRERGSNRVALSPLSPSAAGRGSVLRMPELSVGELRWESAGTVVSTGALKATLSVQLEDAAGGPAVSASITELVMHDASVTALAAS